MAESAGLMLTSRLDIPYSYFVRCIFIISCCRGCTAVQAPQSYQVPWTYQTNAKVWVFETAPLTARPQPLPSQRFSNSWPFKGGRGIFIAARYDNAPLINNKTFYNELVYVPGRYQPCKSSPDAYFSVARMLVDDLHAQAAGRAVWGYPKEMARFNWTTAGASTLVRVHQRGKLIFAANFTDATSSQPYLPPWLISGEQRTIQVPIPRNASAPRALLRSKVQYSFSGGLPTRASVSGLFVDAAAFTNDTALAVTAAAAGEVVRFPMGASGSLLAPEPITC